MISRYPLWVREEECYILHRYSTKFSRIKSFSDGECYCMHAVTLSLALLILPSATLTLLTARDTTRLGWAGRGSVQFQF